MATEFIGVLVMHVLDATGLDFANVASVFGITCKVSRV